MNIGVRELLEYTKIPKKVLIGYLIGVLATGFTLAFVYVYGGGPTLVGNEDFLVVDRMLFGTAALTALIGIGGAYFWFTRDLSTALSPVVGAAFGLYSGFEDLMVYFFCTIRNNGECSGVRGLPGSWSWLEDSQIGILANMLGFKSVSDLALISVVIVSFIFSLLVLKVLYEFEYGDWL
jgi:hypothetical protein